MTSNLSVRVTADVVDLQTKFGIAKAETQALSSEFSKLARASAAGTIDAGGAARMQQLAGDLLAARQQASGYAAEIEKAGFSQSIFNRAAESSHGSISTATREFRALFDELSSGRTRQTPGTLAIIAQRVLGLGPAALGAVAGIGALVGGLGYLAYRAIEASHALSTIRLGADFAGNMDLTRETIQQFITTLSSASNVSKSDAEKIAGSLARIPGMTAPAFSALSNMVSAYMQATGEDAEKAQESITKMFQPKVSAENVAQGIGAISQAQLDMAKNADLSGVASQVAATKIELLNEALGRGTSDRNEYNASMTRSIGNMLAYTGAIESGLTPEETHEMILGTTAAKANQSAAAIARYTQELRNIPATPDQTLQLGVKAAQAENPISQQVQQAQIEINKMSDALVIARQEADQVKVDQLSAGLAKAQENLNNLQFGPVLERMREQMQQVAATWDGTQSGLLTKQQQIAAQALAGVVQGSKEYLAIKTEEAQKEVEIRRAVSSEAVAAARAQVAGISGDSGAIQRLESEKQVWAQLLAGDRLNAAAREEVQRSFNADVTSIARERASQTAAIAKSDATADVAISRMQVEAAKETADAQVATTKEAVAQKYAALKTLTDQEFALDLQALSDEISTLKQGTPQYEEAYNQIRELKEKLVLDLAKLDRQSAEDSRRVAKEQASDWKSAVGEIENAESGMVSDLLSKRKSLSQSLIAIGADLVTKEIANDLKAFTTKLALNNSEKALEQGGFLYHEAIQLLKTGATKTQVAAQTAAVTAGNTAQQTADASAAAAGKALQGATGPAQVMADAAVAAAGGMASVSAIPYIGWAMAPEVGASLYSTVSAFAGPAALDVGTNYVPQDMIAQIHQGEAVVPKEYNPAAGGAAAGTGDTNHNYGGNTINVGSNELKRMISGRQEQRQMMNTLAGAYRRGVRPR